MGFNSVFRSLLEKFPQVDARLLRAVAIGHPKDADVAAEVVLAEIIPSMTSKLPAVDPPQDSSPVVKNAEVESEVEGNGLMHRRRSKDAEVGSSSASHLLSEEGSEAQPVEGHTPNSEDSLQLEFYACPSSTVGETSNVEDNIGGINSHSQHIQAYRIDLLEQTIDEAKTNKKTLFSSMESVINLMREVELQEKAAEQASMEAATGGSNILVRVEEYKTMLVHAKEANDMHAGEIYAEKAILAIELKELQSRLTSLSDERDKSLAILEEMRQTLEARLAAAEILRKAAERETLEKEESAPKALAEQEAMMEKVVQESARLQQEAEENSKLQEFLMDRGRVFDILQGEISVICEDVRLRKEKFDANLPLSKSFTSSQTSCKLASSGSSLKTVASDVGSEQSDSSEILKTSPAALRSLSSKSMNEEEMSKADHDALLDDVFNHLFCFIFNLLTSIDHI